MKLEVKFWKVIGHDQKNGPVLHMSSTEANIGETRLK